MLPVPFWGAKRWTFVFDCLQSFAMISKGYGRSPRITRTSQYDLGLLPTSCFSWWAFLDYMFPEKAPELIKRLVFGFSDVKFLFGTG